MSHHYGNSCVLAHIEFILAMEVPQNNRLELAANFASMLTWQPQ